MSINPKKITISKKKLRQIIKKLIEEALKEERNIVHDADFKDPKIKNLIKEAKNGKNINKLKKEDFVDAKEE